MCQFCNVVKNPLNDIQRSELLQEIGSIILDPHSNKAHQAHLAKIIDTIVGIKEEVDEIPEYDKFLFYWQDHGRS